MTEYHHPVLAQLFVKLRHRTWPEATAHVQGCKYHHGSVRAALAFYGADRRPGYYGVLFTYSIDGKSYDGELMSPVEMKPDATFPIRYNPNHPGRNNTDPHPNWFNYYDYALVAIFLAVILYFAWKH